MNDFVARSRAWICAFAAVAAGTWMVCADPILPYAQPIFTQLSNDIASLEAIPNRTSEQEHQLQTDRAAVKAYQRESRTLLSDISILRSLNSLLEESAGYPSLLTDAVNGYIGDFQARREALLTELLPAPLTKLKTNAFGKLNVISNRLHNASTNESRRAQLSHLAYAASKLTAASNMVHRALRAPVGPTAVWGRVGRLFYRSYGRDTRWSLTNGIFEMYSTNRGPVERILAFHVEGVDTNTSTTYPLVEGMNAAVYVAEQNFPRREGPFLFTGIPGPETNRSGISIDAVTDKFIAGRFNLTAIHTNGPVPDDTNAVPVATITNGFFQLNWPKN